MGFKSVYKIDVDTAAFDRFKEEFAKYDAMLSKMPAAWAESARAQVAATMAMAGINQQVSREEKEKSKRQKEEQDQLKKQGQETAAFWKDIGHSTDRVLSNIGNITRHFLSWSSLTGIFTGLLGIGGSLYGLDRMAFGVGSQRVQAAGLGVSTAEQRAFDVNYRRLFQNPEGVLSNVANAKSDWTKRGYFSVLGVNDIDRKDPAQLAIELTDRAAAIFAKNPTKQYADATGLTNFFSMEDLRSLTAGNRGAARSGYQTDVNRFGFNDSVAEKWQEFSIKMSEASDRIESALVNGLVDLAPTLGKLTDSLAHFVDVAAHGPKVKEWLDGITDALERLTKWIGEKTDGSGAASPGSGGGSDYKSTGIYAGIGAAAGFAAAGPPGAVVGAALGFGVGNAVDKPFHNHNPGNLRAWGDAPIVDGFAQFSSDQEGLNALAKQLLLYQDRDHLNSVREIITKYAPPKENDTGAYIKRVANRLGVNEWEKVNLHDTGILTKLIMAIINQESGRKFGETKIQVSNQIGANITSNSNQAAVTNQ